jgi:predicted RNase H-like HicB family nuclease
MKNNYIFPAIFNKEEDGYNVSFPDLSGAFTCGEDFEEALYMAKECLEIYLEDMKDIPKVGDLENIKLRKNDTIVMVEADLIAFRKKYNNQSVKKTLTIPKWLNDLGIEKHINFSALLKSALMKELEVNS